MEVSKALSLVNSIILPEGTCLLGLHPILVIYYGTDDAVQIFQKIQQNSKTENDKLYNTLFSCLHSSLYPHKKTVWQFNDFSVDLNFFKLILSNDESPESLLLKMQTLESLAETLELHEATYPFIEVNDFVHYDMVDFDENPLHLENKTLISHKEDSGSLLIPAIATTAFAYVLQQSLKEEKW